MIGVFDFGVNGVLDSLVAAAGFVESSFSSRSEWEAKIVIEVVDFDVETLKCDRGAPFYDYPAARHKIQP